MSEDPLVARDQPLTCSVSHERGYAVVSVAGAIDASTEQRFRDDLAGVLSDGATRVVVDLGGVGFMASAGIGVLMGVRRVLADGGGLLVLASPHGEVAQVLSMTGVSAVIPVAASVADAVARLGS
ncbi:MAG TPA: STAS domain-containing protein [Trebonia sp.]